MISTLNLMSYQTTPLIPCQDVQGTLDSLWTEPVWPGADDRFPFMEHMNSQINRFPIQQQLTPGNGKMRDVVVTYFSPIVESEVEEGTIGTTNCVATTKRGNLSKTYTPPDSTQCVEELIAATDLIRFCQDNASYFPMVLARLMRAVRHKVATQLAQEAVLQYGSWGDGTLFPEPSNAAGGVNASDEYVWRTRVGGSALTPAPFDPTAWPTLRMAYDDLGLGEVMMFGGKTGREYLNNSMIGCCTDQGTDLRAALDTFGFSYAYDKRIADALASQDKFLAISPGSLVPVYFSFAEWKNGVSQTFIEMGNTTMFSVADPQSGIPMDVTLTWDCGNLSIFVCAAAKLISLPTDFYSTNDVYSGKNGVVKVLITNP